MDSMIEDQIISCLTDMERLKEQMMDLQKTKIKEDMERENKVKKIEPNIAVLNDWLKNNKELIEEEINNKIIWNKYPILHYGGDGGIHFPDGSNISNKEREIVINYKKTYEKRNQRHLSYDPNFMKDFIEANYNIFNLQQKRIDELETRLEKLEG